MLGNQLANPQSNVRSRLGAVLTNIFALDIEFPGGCGNSNRSSPNEKDFMDDILVQLEILADMTPAVSGRY